jgi:hypothetical protein
MQPARSGVAPDSSSLEARTVPRARRRSSRPAVYGAKRFSCGSDAERRDRTRQSYANMSVCNRAALGPSPSGRLHLTSAGGRVAFAKRRSASLPRDLIRIGLSLMTSKTQGPQTASVEKRVVAGQR